MIKLKDIIDSNFYEIFDTPADKIKWDISDQDLVIGTFTVSNGKKYKLSLESQSMSGDEIDPSNFFDDLPNDIYKDAKIATFELLSDTGDNQSYNNGKMGIEGTGNAAEVFGIVVNGLISYIKKYKPSMIYFQAAEPNRRSLYSVMVNRLIKVLPGWKFKSKDNTFVVYNDLLFQKRRK